MTQSNQNVIDALKPYMPGLERFGLGLVATYPPTEVSPELAARIFVPIQLPTALLLIALAKSLMPAEPVSTEAKPEGGDNGVA